MTANVDLEKIRGQIRNHKTVVFRLSGLKHADVRVYKRNIGYKKLNKLCNIINYLTSNAVSSKDVFFIGPLYLMPFVYHSIDTRYHFQYLVAIRTKNIKKTSRFLPNEHIGMAIFSTNKHPNYNSVKQPYQFCKCCKNTLKDYGGKKHLLNSDGTRISDVWKDFTIDANQEFPPQILRVIKILTKNRSDSQILKIPISINLKYQPSTQFKFIVEKVIKRKIPNKSHELKLKKNKIYNTDVLEGLAKIPDKSVDLALVDPPYNLDVKYGKISDHKDNLDYLLWAEKWTNEIARTLKNGGIFCLINIPKWTLEIFPYLLRNLKFSGWIVWDAWSVPTRTLVPAHYPIICFSKGNKTRPVNVANRKENYESDLFSIFNPINYGYCVRNTCLNNRTEAMKNDRKPLTDLWHDIHRIRHNSFRYNHPTLMPQKLVKRIISIFSKPGDLVLDCFNGVGTSTLVAEKLNRYYIGIEKNTSYYNTSLQRHFIQFRGKDPFEKRKASSTSIQKGYRKVKRQKQVQKNILQLEVKRVAKKLGRCPTEKELEKLGKYPLNLYYDNFRDWAEITVATRRTGITTIK